MSDGSPNLHTIDGSIPTDVKSLSPQLIVSGFSGRYEFEFLEWHTDHRTTPLQPQARSPDAPAWSGPTCVGTKV